MKRDMENRQIAKRIMEARRAKDEAFPPPTTTIDHQVGDLSQLLTEYTWLSHAIRRLDEDQQRVLGIAR